MRALVVALAMQSMLTAGGCGARESRESEPIALVVDGPPPPPREERIELRPGYLWVRGSWQMRGRRWVWRAGRFERERSGQVWIGGHWQLRRDRYHWVEGRWRAARDR